MTIASHAATLLAAAESATLTAPVARASLVGGPSFAKDCRMIAVHPTAIPVNQQAGPAGFAACAYQPRPSLGVTFVADCYPRLEDGRPPRLPKPPDLTAWTDDYLADVWSVHAAVLDAVTSGALGACANVQLTGGSFSGPQGGACWFSIPVTISEDAA